MLWELRHLLSARTRIRQLHVLSYLPSSLFSFSFLLTSSSSSFTPTKSTSPANSLTLSFLFSHSCNSLLHPWSLFPFLLKTSTPSRSTLGATLSVLDLKRHLNLFSTMYLSPLPLTSQVESGVWRRVRVRPIQLVR